MAAGRTSARLSTVDVAATKRSDRDSPSDRQCIFSAFGKARQAAEAARHSGQGEGSSCTLGGRIVRVMRGFRPCTWMRGNVLMLFVPPSGNHHSQQAWHSLPGIGNGDARRQQPGRLCKNTSLFLSHFSPRACLPQVRTENRPVVERPHPSQILCNLWQAGTGFVNRHSILSHGGHGGEGVLRVDNSQFMTECLHRPHLKCP